jgi:hypothetical protein
MMEEVLSACQTKETRPSRWQSFKVQFATQGGPSYVGLMWAKLGVASILGVACFSLSAPSRAACSTDNECPGDDICEEGRCMASPASRHGETHEQPLPPAKGKRHSPGMMAAGIVLTSLAPVGLVVTSFGFLTCAGLDGSERRGTSSCHSELMIGGLIATIACPSIGIPLIVVGARREPVASARVAPWATPHGAGVALRLEL